MRTGQLNGEMHSFRSATWADKYERVPEPTPIPLPCRAEAISVGRCHMLVLDEDNLIWEMRAWGTVSGWVYWGGIDADEGLG
jgi:SCF-associated factor 1